MQDLNAFCTYRPIGICNYQLPRALSVLSPEIKVLVHYFFPYYGYVIMSSGPSGQQESTRSIFSLYRRHVHVGDNY